MKMVYLLRHCEYENPHNILPGRLPVPLSKKGEKQAARLAQYFTDKNIHTIYTSAVLRCKQTTEIVANKKIPIVYDQRLLEVFSAYQGHWNSSATLDWGHFFKHRGELGGESYKDIQNRIVRFWQEIISQNEENIVICSHGDPLFLLYLDLTDGVLPNESEELGDGRFVDYMPKGSILSIEVSEKTCRILPLLKSI